MPRQRTAAAILVETLKAARIERLFTLSGNQILSVFDACLDAGPDLIHVRHEAAAVHMADAWGRLTEQPGVALLTAGPGHANGLSALYVAQQAESPLVLLSGHCPQHSLGRGGFQEMAQAQMAQSLVKASWTADDPSSIGDDVRRALQLARSGRPGPVHVSLPGDLLESVVDSRDASAHSKNAGEARSGSTPRLKDSSGDELLTTLHEAKRPLLLCGPAMMRPSMRASLDTLAQITGCPVIGMESPRGVNDPSLGSLAEILPQADVVLLLGKKLDWSLRFGDEPTFSPTCRFLQIDADQEVLRQTADVLSGGSSAGRLAWSVHADPAAAIATLIQRAASLKWSKSSWSDDVYTAIHFKPAEWEQVAADADGGALHPAQLCRALRRWLEDDAVFVSDGGEFGQWTQAMLTAKHRLINGPSGSIGGAIPFALAAKLAFPQAKVLVTLGDGTFGFHAMEFDTAVRCGLPFVAVVGNDALWNAEHQLQIRLYGADRTIGCDLAATRYDQLVEALGGHGEHVTKLEQLSPALQRAFASGLPSCVNVRILPEPAPLVRNCYQLQQR